MKSHITSDYTFFCSNGRYQLGSKWLTFTTIDPITESIAFEYNHKNDSPTSKEPFYFNYCNKKISANVCYVHFSFLNK